MIVVPSGNGLVGIADRAGYPVLTVPAGYGTGGAGRNPIGVTFVGTAFSEAKLLAAGYAYEQATNVRLAPSFTNPSMWRCVPGSTFFTGELCHPGDRLITPTCTHGSSTGPTTVAAGETLCIRWGGAITGPLTVKAGATLKIDGGTISGPVTVSAGAARRDLRHEDHRPALRHRLHRSRHDRRRRRVTATRSPARSR